MPTQQALDDRLEALIALTNGVSTEVQRDRLIRLVLLLLARLDDEALVQQAIAQVAPIEMAIP